MSEEQKEPVFSPPPLPSEPAGPGAAVAGRRWAWPVLMAALAAIGVVLALADIAIGNQWSDPLASLIVGPTVAASPGPVGRPTTLRYDRNRLGQRFFFAAPFGLRTPISPFQALSALLSNGAGLVLLALAALVLFPSRARSAVDRLESAHGVEIALAAGVAMFLLVLAAVTLLRFTLIFLAVIPVVLVVVLAAALFGIACLSLAIGRLLSRRLRLPQVHPLVGAVAGTLVVFDLAVIPYAGIFVLAAIAIAGLGLAVVARLGSASEWSFSELSW